MWNWGKRKRGVLILVNNISSLRKRGKNSRGNWKDISIKKVKGCWLVIRNGLQWKVRVIISHLTRVFNEDSQTHKF